ncbi:hypothetical protein G9P44_001666 [Scheffersomyces stipitis]|nr:hypothetical protein G9P44_001666 [Scheffersomyces stipitis]
MFFLFLTNTIHFSLVSHLPDGTGRKLSEEYLTCTESRTSLRKSILFSWLSCLDEDTYRPGGHNHLACPFLAQ